MTDKKKAKNSFRTAWGVLTPPTTMAFADFSRQALLHNFRKKAICRVREPSPDKGIIFPPYTCFIYTDRSE